MGNIWEKIGKKDVQSLERIHFFLGGRPYLKTNPKKMQGQVMSGPHIWVPMHRFWWSDPRLPMFLQAQRLVTSPDSPDFFLLLSSSHFLRSFFNLFLSFFPNIPNISSPTRNYFKSRRTYICFPNVPYFPHQFSKFSHVPHHVLPPGRSPA